MFCVIFLIQSVTFWCICHDVYVLLVHALLFPMAQEGTLWFLLTTTLFG